MKKTNCWIVMIATTLTLFLTTSDLHAQTPSVFPNVVAGELLGRGGLYSVNYEHYLHPRLGAGVGGAFYRVDAANVGIIPFYVFANPIGKTHSLYTAAGATFGVLTDSFFGGDSRVTAMIGTVTAGYQYSSRDGFIMRPTINFFYDRHGYMAWPGFMIGHRF